VPRLDRQVGRFTDTFQGKKEGKARGPIDGCREGMNKAISCETTFSELSLMSVALMGSSSPFSTGSPSASLGHDMDRIVF
jgi:hypothetical protein